MDGEEVRTVNLCQQCYNESLTAQGLAPLKNGQWKAVVERRRIVADYGGCWEKTSVYKECESTTFLKERKRKSF